MLCAVLKEADEKAIDEANQQADLLELQVDFIQGEELAKLRRCCLKPVIFKMAHFDPSLLSLAPDYIDLPHTIDTRVFKYLAEAFPHIKSICSYHDFEKTEDLEEVLELLSKKKANLCKVSTFARETIDALKMLKLVKKYLCIGICMGEVGSITRILAPVFGAPWTYAPLREEQKTAPGQLLLRELIDCYHFRKLSPKTDLYGLIGNPVSKSVSHRTHNFAFRKLKIDAVYVKMNVKERQFNECLPVIKELGFKGLSVTMPLKEEAACLTGNLSSPINTLCFKQEDISGWNTDGAGALDVLEKHIKVHGKRVVLIGAGGTAFGIALEAKKRGAHLIIVNRTFERAVVLAGEVGGTAYPLEAFHEVAKKGYDVLINCTSIGMEEDSNLPVLSADLLEKKVVMDVVSKNKLTPFLEAANEKSCTLIEGIEMFIKQAVYQFCHWFGISTQ